VAIAAVHVAALAVLAPAAAGAAVYWAGGSTIGAANLDGSALNEKYFKPPFPSDSAGPECGLAVSDSYLYWVGAFGLGRVNFDGPATPTSISPHLERPCGVATNQSHVYWADKGTGTIGRANLDGSEPNLALVGGLENPCAIAVGSSHIYWIDTRGIGRADLDGAEVAPGWVPIGGSGCGLALGAQYIYFTGNSPSPSQPSIGRVTYDGAFRQMDFITGLEEVSDIAVDSGHVYWVDRRWGMNYASIGRAIVDGSDVNRAWIPTQNFNVGAVAVDSRPSPPPLPLPSRPISFGKVRHNLKDGSLLLDVFVPARGELTLASPGIGWKVLKGPEPPPYVAGSFRWQIKLWPGQTRFGKKIRTRLLLRGRAVLELHLSYAEEGQLPETAEKQLALLQHRARPSKTRHPR
jgi:virginiamycin B lyase